MQRAVLTAVTAVSLAMIAGTALADFNDKNPITATVTGATPTGYPRVMVEGMNAIVREAFPGSSVSLKPNSPGGGVLAIAEKESDFTATASGTEIKLGVEGKMPFDKPLKGKISYVMMLYDNQFIHTLMTKEWADANGVKTWDDIGRKKPKARLAINRPDNPQTTIGGPYEVMKAHGFTIDDIQKWGGSYVLGNSTIGLDAIKDGKADLFMNARNFADSAIKDIAASRALMWIDGNPATVDKAAKVFDFRMDMMPKGTYVFLDKDYPAVRQWVALIAGEHVADETVYKYTKAMAENAELVTKIGGNMAQWTTKLMVTKPTDLPWHPGALRYYKEKGWVN